MSGGQKGGVAVGAVPEVAVRDGVEIHVEAAAPGVPISPTLYGIFFEDINFGADGGLSAELVKNGSFEFMDGMMGWRKIENQGAVGGFGVRESGSPFPNNPRFARLTVESAGQGFGIRNEGYRGMGLKVGGRYRFSAMARLSGGAARALRIELLGAGDTVIGAATVEVASREWRRVEGELTAAATEARGALRIMMDQAGIIDLDAVSLMPLDTWKHRENGWRPDLVQKLADLKPGFIRFPGGCIVEGRVLSNRYQWKNTVGPVDNRTMIYNRWNVEFAGSGKGAADYFQSFRLGFYEYFLLCEDLGSEPVPILNCGMACQYNSGELAPIDEMNTFVQDALDLVEFANGAADTTWGRVRAGMGHPEPFGLKKIGIGNEQWGAQYFERYEVVAKALRVRYPDIRLIASAGPSPAGQWFDAAWSAMPSLTAEIVDEHCYANPEWFLDGAFRYDGRTRTGPKVFMGEYAAHDKERRNTWLAALAEAAFMTGLERNADLVAMSSYAPLFAHAEAWQWAPNLIWFDNLLAVGTPSYEVQRLFSLNRGDVSLPVAVRHPPLAENGNPRFYAASGRDNTTGELVVKVVNATAGTRKANLVLDGAGELDPVGRAISIVADPDDENLLGHPDKVVPHESPIGGVSSRFSRDFAPWSVTVLRLRARATEDGR